MRAVISVDVTLVAKTDAVAATEIRVTYGFERRHRILPWHRRHPRRGGTLPILSHYNRQFEKGDGARSEVAVPSSGKDKDKEMQQSAEKDNAAIIAIEKMMQATINRARKPMQPHKKDTKTTSNPHNMQQSPKRTDLYYEK